MFVLPITLRVSDKKEVIMCARSCCTVLAFATLLFLPAKAFTQSALPFLSIPVSPEGNGMGGIATAVVSDHAIASMANPAQLGIFSLTGYFTGATYVPVTNWLPTFRYEELTLNASAVQGGINLRSLLELPLDVSVGVGFSRTHLNLGTFIVTDPNGVEVGRHTSYEKAETYHVGFGVSYIASLGVGFGFKRTLSKLGSISYEDPNTLSQATPSATDFGILLRIPVMDVVHALSDGRETRHHVVPLFDITCGYARRNVGDDVRYTGSSQTDPLPRTAALGMGVDVGVTIATTNRNRLNVISFTLARETEDLLIQRFPDGSFDYKSGLGDISFFENVIGGKQHDFLTSHKGWQLSVGGLVTIRGGSVLTPGNVDYTTSGFGFRMSGLFDLIEMFNEDADYEGVLGFVRHHMDLRYDYASYTDHVILGGTSFQCLNLILR
jgi:hypothetical protein